MRAYDIIDKKRRGEKLQRDEIDFIIKGFVDETIPDYQVSSLLMAICINGMDEEETYYLCDSMLHSGDVMDLSRVRGITVDKHSTGGVGDTTTLALAPVLACCGVYVAKMSGRGLGFTGGTIDKLESIPHFNTALSQEQFFDTVNKVGCAVVGQTADLVPADKKLYALRDVTATIDSIPLICSSIMSKKIASGAGAILLDVKYGSGAFMKTAEQATLLARAMVDIGVRYNRKIGALVTDMSQPLSSKIGNALEIVSAIDILSGTKNRLYFEMREVCAKLLELSGKYCFDEALDKVESVIASGEALAKFSEMVTAQGGDRDALNNPQLLLSKKLVTVRANRSGYVCAMDTARIGSVLTMLGGGRLVKSDAINHAVGIELHCEIGQYVSIGDAVATLYHDDKNVLSCEQIILDSLHFEDVQPQGKKLAYAYVSQSGVEYY